MNNEKLKPCPFCGGVADFKVRLLDAARGISQLKAACMACEVELPRGLMSMNEFRCDKDYLDATKVAVEQWNKRAE